jgi:hypothetical protein
MGDDVPASFEEFFKKWLKEEKEVLERAILNGSCKSFEDYRWYSGQLQGLRLAEMQFDAIAQRYREQ